MVNVKLQQYVQKSLHKGYPKLQPYYFGPFPIIDKIEKVAYKVQLPSDSLIHNVYHVSLLKPASASVSDSATLPPMSSHSTIYAQAILDRRMVKKENAATTQLLIHWQNTSPIDSTWEFADEIQWRFLNFPWGQENSSGEVLI